MLDGEHTYLLSYKADSAEHISIVSRYLVQNKEFRDVISPTPLVTFFRSRLNVVEISNDLNFLFPNGAFFVAEIDHRKIEGKLPGKVWLWFYEADEDEFIEKALPKPRNIGSS